MFAMSAVCAILHTDQWESYWKHSRKIFTRTPEIKFLFTLSTRGLLTKAKQSVEYVHLGIGVTLSLGVGSVAQLVEQRTENPCVGGSIPPLPTFALLLCTDGMLVSSVFSLYPIELQALNAGSPAL